MSLIGSTDVESIGTDWCTGRVGLVHHSLLTSVTIVAAWLAQGFMQDLISFFFFFLGGGGGGEGRRFAGLLNFCCSSGCNCSHFCPGNIGLPTASYSQV